MPKPQIILISSLPVFNKELVSPVGDLSASDASMLFQLLLLNNIENIKGINTDYELRIFLNSKDQDSISDNFTFSELRFFDPAPVYGNIRAHISKRVNAGNTHFIMLFGNTIGFSPGEYEKILNLLNYEDNSLVLGKSKDDRLSLIGFNYYDANLFHKLHELNPDINDYLKRVTGLDYYLFIQNGYPFINDFNDFRRLYKMLSTKESIEYCSHEIHEQFTHLFIEYKESL